MARLEVYVGPVASCKTAMLHREMLTYYGRGYTVCVVSSTETGDRESTPLSTNQGIELGIPRGVATIRVHLLSELQSQESFLKSAVVCIDEAQFFPDLVSSVEKMLRAFPHKLFIVSGLDAWAVGGLKPTEVINLCIYASSFNKLLAGCDKCTADYPTEVVTPNACYSYCIDKSLTKTISLGGKERFLALCPRHYYERTSK